MQVWRREEERNKKKEKKGKTLSQRESQERKGREATPVSGLFRMDMKTDRQMARVLNSAVLSPVNTRVLSFLVTIMMRSYADC